VIAIEPIGASACMRAARLVECPTGTYSACAPVLTERITTSPLFAPTRAWIGWRASARNRSE
jgi:hypothetical protein